MALTKVKAGNILLTTPSASSNDVTPATTQYVTTAIGNLVDTAPSTLNTLNELAAALGDDVNFSTTVTNSIATKLPLAGGTLTGTLTVAGSSSGTVDALIITNTDTTNNGLSIGVDSSENAFFWNGSNTSMNFATNNTERMRITSTGEIVTGGLTSSTGQLHLYKADATGGKLVLQSQVASDATAKITMMSRLLDNTNKNAYIEAYRGNINFGGDAGYGNVGIGTNNPAQLLEVSGNAGKSRFTRSGSAGTTMEFYAGASQSGGIQVQSTGLGISGGAGENHVFIDTSGNVGIGCTPSAHAFSKAIQIGDGAVWTVGGNQNSTFASNAYLAVNGQYKYIAANKASKINLYNGGFTVATTNTSGSANSDITFTDRLTVLANGNVGIGTANPIGKLDIKSTSSTRNIILKEDENVGDGSYGPHYEYKVAYIAGNSLNTQLTIPFTSRSYNQTGYFKIRVIPALHNLTTVARVATAEFALGLSYPNVVSIGSVLSSSGNYSSSSAGTSYLRIVFSNNYSNATMSGAFIHMEFFGQQGTAGAPDYANISFN